MRNRVVSALGVLALGLLPVASAQATFPGDNGRIAFAAFSNSGEENEISSHSRSIDVALASGKARRSLRVCPPLDAAPGAPTCPIFYSSPAWSPKGTRLAFEADLGLAVMRSDGSGYRRLALQTSYDRQPAWSPDGTRLVFSGPPMPGMAADLFIHDLVSGDTRRLTFRGGRSPDWSSRGTIAFVRGARAAQPGLRPGAGDIYTIRPNGKGLRRITHRRGEDPSWSPDGRRIAFTRQRRFDGFQLWVVRSDGRRLRRLPTPEVGDAENPSWSPDGRWITYEGFEAGVFAQRIDGGRHRQVASSDFSSTGNYGAFDAAWQPLPRR
jgi:Tol biopolymer transport system component